MKSKLFKISSGIFLILMALWVATPKVYIHDLLNHHHESVLNLDGKVTVNEHSDADDCDFEKYNSPSYFNIFNFLTSFIPSKPQSELIKFNDDNLVKSKLKYYFSLRAPPSKA